MKDSPDYANFEKRPDTKALSLLKKALGANFYNQFRAINSASPTVHRWWKR